MVLRAAASGTRKVLLDEIFLSSTSSDIVDTMAVTFSQWSHHCASTDAAYLRLLPLLTCAALVQRAAGTTLAAGLVGREGGLATAVI